MAGWPSVSITGSKAATGAPRSPPDGAGRSDDRLSRPRTARLSRTKLAGGWRVTPVDIVIAAVILAGVGFVAYRLDAVLNYQWRWSYLPQYFARFTAEGDLVPNILVTGFLTTLRLAVWGSVLAALLGGLIGICRVSPLLLLRLIGRTYVELLRNLPALVLVFIGYFFISSQIVPLLGLDRLARDVPAGLTPILWVLFGDPRLLPNFLSGTVCLALFESAFVAEIVRAGIQSIDTGQWEAARALGLHRGRVLRLVILPQAVARMVPALCGQFIALIKDSSIVSLISVQDLTFMASDVAVSTGRIFETWIAASVVYFATCLGLSLLFGRLERRVGRFRR